MLDRFAFLSTLVQYDELNALGACLIHMNIFIFIATCVIVDLSLVSGYFVRIEEEVKTQEFE